MSTGQKWGITISVSAVLTVILTFVINSRTLAGTEQQQIIKDLRIEVKGLREEVRAANKTINELRAKLIYLESAHFDMPIAAWLKDNQGRMLSLNDAYEFLYLMPDGFTRNDRLGKTDIEFLPDCKEVAREWRANDLEVMRTGRATRLNEKIVVNGQTIELIVFKYPYFYHNDLIGIAGLAIEKLPQ